MVVGSETRVRKTRRCRRMAAALVFFPPPPSRTTTTPSVVGNRPKNKQRRRWRNRPRRPEITPPPSSENDRGEGLAGEHRGSEGGEAPEESVSAGYGRKRPDLNFWKTLDSGSSSADLEPLSSELISDVEGKMAHRVEEKLRSQTAHPAAAGGGRPPQRRRAAAASPPLLRPSPPLVGSSPPKPSCSLSL
jgi:hypothetical protein